MDHVTQLGGRGDVCYPHEEPLQGKQSRTPGCSRNSPRGPWKQSGVGVFLVAEGLGRRFTHMGRVSLGLHLPLVLKKGAAWLSCQPDRHGVEEEEG